MRKRSAAASLSALCSLVCLTSLLHGGGCQPAGWETQLHEENRCAMYGSCGTHAGALLPCPNNTVAQPVNEELTTLLATDCPYLWNNVISSRGKACCDVTVLRGTIESMKQAAALVGGCPACDNNFGNLWCTMSCHPDQSLYTTVVETQVDRTTRETAVSEVHVYFDDAYKTSLYDSCVEVQFSAANVPFMVFMGNPDTPDDFLSFLGSTPADGGLAPYDLKFPNASGIPTEMTPHTMEIPGCGSPGYECSCADCSGADYCAVSHGGDGDGDDNDGFRDYEYGIVAAGVVGLLLVFWLIQCSPFESSMREISFPEYGSDYSYEPLSDGNEFSAVLLEGEALVYPWMQTVMRNCFKKLGIFVAQFPCLTMAVSFLIVALLAIGNVNYGLVSDPQGLWTPKGSRTEKEQKRYQEAFGKFYRAENIVIASTPETEAPRVATNGLPIISTYNNINLLFQMQEEIDRLEGHYSDGDMSYVVRLEDVCYKRLGVCVIESVLQYWHMDQRAWEREFRGIRRESTEARALDVIDDCYQRWTIACTSAYEAPMDPNIVLGGFPMDESFESFINDTTAFSVTYLLDNNENIDAAMAWEKAYLDLCDQKLKDMAANASLQLTYMAERSSEDEIDRETYMDAGTVATSYVVMFLYIALALTFLTKRRSGAEESVLVRSHLSLALVGIGVVCSTVIGALGVISMLNMEVSLITLEVLPLLILAVGVDNMFILANEIRSLDPGLSLPLRLSTALAEVGPSITCAAGAEALAFGMAGICDIPAIRVFALSACIAVLLDFFLQCTFFAAYLVLDTKRRESNRADCWPCIWPPRAVTGDDAGVEYAVLETGTPPQEVQQSAPENFIERFISGVYVPFLLGVDKKWVRLVALSLTVAAFATSCALMGRMELGLEEQVAFPLDSYLQDYYNDGLPQLRIGAPVMYVVEDINVSMSSEDPNKICGIAGCRPDSFVAQIDLAAREGRAHISSVVSSWLDEFLMWVQTPSCCRVDTDFPGEYCPAELVEPACVPCTLEIADETQIYQKYLPGFMKFAPGEICPRGGLGAFEDYIQHAKGNSSDIVGLDNEMIRASSFRTYYIPLITQNDLIESLQETQDFADELKESIGLDIYAYSIIHIYFQQYIGLIPTAVWLISGSVAAVFVMCWILLSSFRVALIVILCVVLSIVDIVGICHLCDVKLNGVSVVNLTMSIGIAVEFCVHLAHGFLVVPGSRVGRVAAAFQGMGISVVSGITFTKFLGVAVLVFAQTKLFQVYYFRMYIALVLAAAWHGLVVLPLLLALVGPPSPVTRATTTVDEAEGDAPPMVPVSKEA